MWAELDWGTVPAGAAALLTGTSAVIAAMSYKRSVRERETEQASQVATWFADNPEDEGVVWVVNHSSTSVFDVQLVLPSSGEVLELRELGADQVARAQVDPTAREVTVRVGFEIGFALAFAIRARSARRKSVLPRIRFRDSLGRPWERDSQGRLRQLSERQFNSYDLTLKAFGIPLMTVSTGDDGVSVNLGGGPKDVAAPEKPAAEQGAEAGQR